MYLKIIVGCLLFVALQTNQARVYKWIDAAGQVHYSDQQSENAQEVQLNIPQTSTAQTQNDTDAMYNFELMQPTENQTINTDTGEIIVSVLIEPALQPGHAIQFALDGGLVPKNFTETQVMLRPVTLGTHKIYAAIVDDAGKIIMQSKTIIFHVRKNSPISAQPIIDETNEINETNE